MRISPRVLAAFAAPLLSLPLAAQTGSFTTFGAGCPGSANPAACHRSNDNASALQSLFFSQTSEVCLEVPAMTGTKLITGFEIFTKARFGKFTTTGRIHLADSSGKPVTAPAASANMVVDTKLGWYRTTLAKPLVLKSNQKFFISWADSRVPFSQNCLWPVPTSGTKGVSYHRFATSGAFSRGPFNTYPWSFRVLCIGSKRDTPALTNTGLPKIGTSYSVNVAKARPSAVLVLITGLSNTTWSSVKLPLNLAGLGAGACNLHVSFDFVSGAASSSSGTGSLTVPVPNVDRFIGAQLHHQWMIFDNGSNALGLVFSNAGTAKVGK